MQIPSNFLKRANGHDGHRDCGAFFVFQIEVGFIAKDCPPPANPLKVANLLVVAIPSRVANPLKVAIPSRVANPLKVAVLHKVANLLMVAILHKVAIPSRVANLLCGCHPIQVIPLPKQPLRPHKQAVRIISENATWYLMYIGQKLAHAKEHSHNDA